MTDPIEAIIAQLRYAQELIKAQGIDLDTDKCGPLSPLEAIVLQLCAEGYSSQEIAEKVHRSVRTVENIRYRILGKLGAKTMAQAVSVGWRKGILK